MKLERNKSSVPGPLSSVSLTTGLCPLNSDPLTSDHRPLSSDNCLLTSDHLTSDLCPPTTDPLTSVPRPPSSVPSHPSSVQNMQRTLPLLTLLTILLLLPALSAIAQTQMDRQSQMFRLGDGIIRIAELGQLADSVNVWGDISNSGRYLIPRGTTVMEMISYARGPINLRTGEITLDWSRVRVEIAISRFDKESKEENVDVFVYQYNHPVPEELRNYKLKNGDVLSVQVRREPTFRDYISVISPVLSLLLSTWLLYDRIRDI